MGSACTKGAGEVICGGELSLKQLEKIKIQTKFVRRKNKIYPDCNRNIADNYLKALLTHPIILKYFRRYCRQVGSPSTLEFYLNCQRFRRLVKEHAPSSILSEHFKLIMKNQPYYQQTRTVAPIIEASKLEDSCFVTSKIEELRLAQYESLFSLKEYFWFPFCHSALYIYMMAEKEVRTLLELNASYFYADNVLGGDYVPITHYPHCDDLYYDEDEYFEKNNLMDMPDPDAESYRYDEPCCMADKDSNGFYSLNTCTTSALTFKKESTIYEDVRPFSLPSRSYSFSYDSDKSFDTLNDSDDDSQYGENTSFHQAMFL